MFCKLLMIKLGIEHASLLLHICYELFIYLAIDIPALLCQLISGAMFVFHIRYMQDDVVLFCQCFLSFASNCAVIYQGWILDFCQVRICTHRVIFFKVRPKLDKILGGWLARWVSIICCFTTEKIPLELLTSATCLYICPHRIQFYLQFPCVAKVVQAMKHC